jgi:hypothetical protein
MLVYGFRIPSRLPSQGIVAGMTLALINEQVLRENGKRRSRELNVISA